MRSVEWYLCPTLKDKLPGSRVLCANGDIFETVQGHPSSRAFQVRFFVQSRAALCTDAALDQLRFFPMAKFRASLKQRCIANSAPGALARGSRLVLAPGSLSTTGSNRFHAEGVLARARHCNKPAAVASSMYHTTVASRRRRVYHENMTPSTKPEVHK